MSFLRNTIIFFAVLFLFIQTGLMASAGAETNTESSIVEVSVNKLRVTHAGIFASPTYGTNDEDSNAGHLSVGFGNTTLHSALEHFLNGSDEIPDFIYEATFRFSLVPMVLENKTKEELFTSLDHKIELAKQTTFIQMQPLVAKKVDAALAAVPPGPVRDQLRLKFIADGEATLRQEIENKASEIRANKQKELDHRVTKVKVETMYQEFAIGFSKVVKNGQILAFVKGGKFRIENGPALDRNNQSRLSQIRATNSWVQEQVANTLAIDAGVITRIDKDTSIRYDLFLFHDRLPFLSGKEFVASAATLDQEQFDEHMKWAKIDSTLLRVLFNKNNIKNSIITGIQIHGSAGSYSGNFGGSAGLVAKIGEDNELIIDYVRNASDLKRVEEGVSAFFIRHITNRLNVYAGFEHLKEAKRPLISDESSDEQNIITGAGFTLINDRIFGLIVKSTIKGETQWNLNNSPNRKTVEFLTNLTLDVLW